MPAVTPLLQKIADLERNQGLMTIFQHLSREEQLALMEWSRAMCIELASMVELQEVYKLSGRNDNIDLPVPKIFIEIALKTAAIRGIMAGNDDLQTGCDTMYKHIFGESKAKAFDVFKDNVRLAVQLSKW